MENEDLGNANRSRGLQKPADELAEVILRLLGSGAFSPDALRPLRGISSERATLRAILSVSPPLPHLASLYTYLHVFPTIIDIPFVVGRRRGFSSLLSRLSLLRSQNGAGRLSIANLPRGKSAGK